jgi:excisionase family DNA binding protein
MDAKSFTSPVQITSAPPVRLLSLKGAATYPGLSYWGLRSLIWHGELPAVRVGRRILVDIRDLNAFIEHNKTVE